VFYYVTLEFFLYLIKFLKIVFNNFENILMQVTDKFMDLNIEKTNSAYMLFYEKVDVSEDEATPGPSTETEVGGSNREEEKGTFDLSPALEEWIWQDNKNFIQDNNIFDHTYFK
jgi:hypothetical protein